MEELFPITEEHVLDNPPYHVPTRKAGADYTKRLAAIHYGELATADGPRRRLTFWALAPARLGDGADIDRVWLWDGHQLRYAIVNTVRETFQIKEWKADA